MKLPKDTTPEFKRWWAAYTANQKAAYGFTTRRLLPSYYGSAEDFVAQYDRLNHYTGNTYDWNPSPITSKNAKAVRELRDTVTVTEEGEE